MCSLTTECVLLLYRHHAGSEASRPLLGQGATHIRHIRDGKVFVAAVEARQRRQICCVQEGANNDDFFVNDVSISF